MLKGLLVFLKSYINSHIFVVLVVFGWFMWNPMQLGEFIVEYMLSIKGGIVVEGLIVLYSLNSAANRSAGIDIYNEWVTGRLKYEELWLLYIIIAPGWLFVYLFGVGVNPLVLKIYLLYVGVLLYKTVCVLCYDRGHWTSGYRGEARLDKDYVLIYVHIILFVYCIGVVYGLDVIKSVVMTFDFFIYFWCVTILQITNKGLEGGSWMKNWSEPLWFFKGEKKSFSIPQYGAWLHIVFLLVILYHMGYLLLLVLNWLDIIWWIVDSDLNKMIYFGSWILSILSFCSRFFSEIKLIVAGDNPIKYLKKSTTSGWIALLLCRITYLLINSVWAGIYTVLKVKVNVNIIILAILIFLKIKFMYVMLFFILSMIFVL